MKYLVAGSTGLIGKNLINILSKDSPVTALTRRNFNFPDNVTKKIVDFENGYDLPRADHLFICLGFPVELFDLAIMRKSVKKLFYKVDYEYTLNIAKKAEEVGATSISLVSAVGANKNSESFYLKTKGDLEEEIKKLKFETINIFQPGHLAGRISWQKKKSDPRIDVFAFEIGSLFLDPFLVSRLNKFRSINANKLANFIVKSTINENLGINQYQYSDF